MKAEKVFEGQDYVIISALCSEGAIQIACWVSTQCFQQKSKEQLNGRSKAWKSLAIYFAHEFEAMWMYTWLALNTKRKTEDYDPY